MFNILPFLLSFLFLASCTHDTLKKSTEEKTELNTINELYKSTALEIKVYFENPNLDDSSYVIRYVDKASPLKNSIQEYLNGLTPEEKKLGFETSNFGKI